LFLYGNDVVDRNRTDTKGFGKTWIDPTNLLLPGFLSRYFLYANPAARLGPIASYSPTVTRIQIWRPASGPQSPQRPTFTLVWEREVQLNTTIHGQLYAVFGAQLLSIY